MEQEGDAGLAAVSKNEQAHRRTVEGESPRRDRCAPRVQRACRAVTLGYIDLEWCVEAHHLQRLVEALAHERRAAHWVPLRHQPPGVEKRDELQVPAESRAQLLDALSNRDLVTVEHRVRELGLTATECDLLVRLTGPDR